MPDDARPLSLSDLAPPTDDLFGFGAGLAREEPPSIDPDVDDDVHRTNAWLDDMYFADARPEDVVWDGREEVEEARLDRVLAKGLPVPESLRERHERRLAARDLPAVEETLGQASAHDASASSPLDRSSPAPEPVGPVLNAGRDPLDAGALRAAIRAAGGSLAAAARSLGLSTRQVRWRVDRLGLRDEVRAAREASGRRLGAIGRPAPLGLHDVVRLAGEGESIGAIARRYGVDERTVRRRLRGE